MSQRVVECVPNFSEGRDPARIKAITDAIEAVKGVRLLDVDPGADTHRTVVTFVGDPEAVLEGAFQAVRTAAQVLDMRTHQGAHPRMGATDVCPFVPVAGVSMEDCAELARRLGERAGRELEIPVFLYEHAARRPERRNLASVRKGEYEGLADKLKDPDWAPDFGPARVHPRAGALITGAREFLIAYNITLASRDKSHASDIAFELREKGRVARRGQSDAFYASGQELRYAEGCFPCGNCSHDASSFEALEAHCRDSHGYDLAALLRLNDLDPEAGLVGQKAYRAGLFQACKAIGWVVEEYRRAQLSINLTDFHRTPPHRVLEAARRLAAERGLVVTGSEIVGLVPFEALLQAGRFYLERQGRSPEVPWEDALECAVFAMGLSDVAPFDLRKKVLGLPAVREGGLAAMTVRAVATEVSRDTPAPGGGSIAALSGALAAGLASMVANLTKPRDQARGQELRAAAALAHRVREALVMGVDEDTDAFNGYLQARRLPQGSAEERAAREEAMQAGLKQAVRVPLRTAERSLEAMETAAIALRLGNPASLSDALVGLQTGFGAVRGGIWNVLINLKDIHDPAFRTDMEARCADLLTQARALLDAAAGEGDQRLASMLGH
ncbi:MAG: glutamate formimidoyltransferase [Acidobacteria bacterium]|nr:glutamate formimidoyltransferase [Acidobacteriota bacterium]